MFKVNERDKKICEMVCEMISNIEKFNSDKIDITANEEFERIVLSSEEIEDIDEDSSTIAIKYYKLPIESSMILSLNSSEWNYKHSINIYKNDDPELFNQFVDVIGQVYKLKNDYILNYAKVLIDDIAKKL